MFAFVKGRVPTTVLVAVVIGAIIGRAVVVALGIGVGVVVGLAVWFVYPAFSEERATSPPSGPTLPPSLHERERKAAEGDPEYGPDSRSG
jgi:hypothetical protein